MGEGNGVYADHWTRLEEKIKVDHHNLGGQKSRRKHQKEGEVIGKGMGGKTMKTIHGSEIGGGAKVGDTASWMRQEMWGGVNNLRG